LENKNPPTFVIRHFKLSRRQRLLAGSRQSPTSAGDIPKNMTHLEPPNIYQDNKKSLFLAGGISNCPDWQMEMIELLKDEDIVLLNPRRTDFPIDDPSASEKQIKWEYQHLQKADALSFWFPEETLCPITLYELGVHLMIGKPVFIGVHPNYKRKLDIEVQTKLIRSEIEIVYDLVALSEQIKNWIRE